ncbi:hypothetical protein AQUCO_07600100v1 [Aquilegia coerulea]|uniref:RING-type domain-containing protein n=1 Tax=Aquilegia coerulea TaxID=218851 RepID=A0A2G5C8T0_AQUCA|nr:hypothetical protein AQUCO_07600100v1 [Aquilegia coerulea]
MTIRFKFRSSVNFDSIDINGRPSISVRDLRSKIVEQKNLKICHDFDLVISDSVTGKEYEDENSLVPSDSSVILKRVPAGRTAPSILPCIDTIENVGIKQTDPLHSHESSHPGIVDLENFDDFGIDLYPALGESLLDFDPDIEKMNCITNRRDDNAKPRYSETSIVRCENREASDFSETVQKDAMENNLQVDTLQVDFKSKMEEKKKLDNMVNTFSPLMLKSDLPSELRCSLCNTIFQEAVMIPCCQHSFCEKCIHLVLLEKGRCPKCLSTKCRVEDLLPNLSLRQAIEHFLESQMLISGSDHNLPKYAPDGESGIQAKEVSCAISVRRREPALPHSPSATGKGSNQVMTASVYGAAMRNKGSVSRTHHLDAAGKTLKSASSLYKINGESDAVPCIVLKNAPEGKKSVADFQGESQPIELPRTVMQEAHSAMKKKGSYPNSGDGVGSFVAASKYRKGERTCYMCGSPDHFIRDCPAATGQYPMYQTGDAMYPGGIPAYGPPYWQGSPYPPVRPFGNVYATPGMMPFTPTMVPVTPFQVPYMSSMYGGMSVPCGYMGTGGFVPPVASRAERPVSQAELMELQDNEQRHKLISEQRKREKLSDGVSDEGYQYPQLSYDCKPRLDRENSPSYSENNDTHKSRKKHPHYNHLDEDPYTVDRRHDKGCRSSNSGRDRRAYHHDASSSGIQEKSGSSNQQSRERHRRHQRSPRKNSERKQQYDIDSMRKNHHHTQKESGTDRKRVESDVKRHGQRHHSQSESGLEPVSSGDRKRQRKEKETSHSSKHSRHNVKSRPEELSHERWELINGLDEGYKEDYYHHHKRKRRH